MLKSSQIKDNLYKKTNFLKKVIGIIFYIYDSLGFQQVQILHLFEGANV